MDTMTSGIYKITSPSGKMYIGSAVNFGSRWRTHTSSLKNGKHHCRGLQNACNKYGCDNLKFEKILVCAPGDLIFYEQRFIDAYSGEGLYNSCRTAGSFLGMTHSEETKLKMSEWQIGKTLTEETKAKISSAAKGRKYDAATREKLSLSNRWKKKPNNTSGHVGVYLDKQTGKWVAQARINGKKKHVGIFTTLEDAVIARENFIIHHKE